MKDTLNIPMVCTDHIYLVQQSPSNLTFILRTASPKAGSETRVIYNQRIFLPPLLISISDHNTSSYLQQSASSILFLGNQWARKYQTKTSAVHQCTTGHRAKTKRHHPHPSVIIIIITIIIVILSSYSNFLDSVRAGSLAGAAESS